MDFVTILGSMNVLIALAAVICLILAFCGLIAWMHKSKIRKTNEKAASDWENDFLTYR